MKEGIYILNLVGGLGLFLLGMSSLTEGLREVTGPKIRDLLDRFTRNRLTAIALGAGLTAGVQSSSAAILAVIGFVNAGIVDLAQAVGLVLGANVGTTFTGWLVSILGFKVNVGAFALPAVGVGALLRVFGHRRFRATGIAVAGFGLLFLGIETMGTGLESDTVQRWFSLLVERKHGGLERLALVGTGLLLTALMQSSSAVLAVTLTALAAGVLDLSAGAAVAIGSNIGTTVTAVLAGVGAEADSRRTAVAHVTFNVVTAGFALVFFNPLIGGITAVGKAAGMTEPPSLLAAFHTCFNLMGLVILAPWVPQGTALLRRVVPEGPLPPGRPRYLNPNVLAVPELAAEAVEKELHYLYRLVTETIRTTFRPAKTAADLEDIQRVEHRLRVGTGDLALAIGSFAERIQSERLSPEVATRVPAFVRAAANARLAAEYCTNAIRIRTRIHGRATVNDTTVREMEELILGAAVQLADDEIPAGERKRKLAATRKAVRRLRKALRGAIFSGIAHQTVSADTGILLSDYPTVLERIAYHLLRAASHHAAGDEADVSGSVPEEAPPGAGPEEASVDGDGE